MGYNTRNSRHISPHFFRLVSWVNESNIEKLQDFFPIEGSPRSWVTEKHGTRERIDLDMRTSALMHLKSKGGQDERVVAPGLIQKIYPELVEPLFVRRQICVKHEDDVARHRRENLFCLVELLRRDLFKIRNSDNGEFVFRKVVLRFHRDLEALCPGIGKPLDWALEPEDSQGYYGLRREINRLTERIDDGWRAQVDMAYIEVAAKKWRHDIDERDEKYLKRRGTADFNDKLNLAIGTIERMLSYLKLARGKPGRPPEPYNVFVYHLINRCTRWKLDRHQGYILKKDGQHKLERDWRLIIFLLLDVHVNRVKLPKLAQFIRRHGRQPAADAMRALKNDLWNRYKNFPPIHGWPMEREGVRRPETGFRKLVVTDEGTLRIITL